MRIHLIRHGQTPSNVLHALDTAVPGPGLTDLGRRQAEAIPAALASADVEAVWASTMTRTQETAAPLARSLGADVRVVEGLQEVDAGDYEMRSDREAVLGYMGPIMAWASGDLGPEVSGGRSGAETFAGYDDAIAQVAASGASVAAVFSHGAAIRMWAAARVEGVSVELAQESWLDNTGAITFDAVPEGETPDSGRRWTLVDWRSEPLGGRELSALPGGGAADEGPTGEPLSEWLSDDEQ